MAHGPSAITDHPINHGLQVKSSQIKKGKSSHSVQIIFDHKASGVSLPA